MTRFAIFSGRVDVVITPNVIGGAAITSSSISMADLLPNYDIRFSKNPAFPSLFRRRLRPSGGYRVVVSSWITSDEALVMEWCEI